MSWGDGSGVPTSGKNLVVVGTDNNGSLHIRIFDATGNRTKDTDETQLPAQAAAIATLKQRLPGLSPPHVLTGMEKEQVIAEATSIVDQTQKAFVTEAGSKAQPGESEPYIYVNLPNAPALLGKKDDEVTKLIKGDKINPELTRILNDKVI